MHNPLPFDFYEQEAITNILKRFIRYTFQVNAWTLPRLCTQRLQLHEALWCGLVQVRELNARKLIQLWSSCGCLKLFRRALNKSVYAFVEWQLHQV